MQIASEAIRLTFKHWPPSEGLTRQPYCLAINLHLITHNAPLVGGNLLGSTPPRREPGDNMVTPVYKALTRPGTRNAAVERPGRSQPCPLLSRQHRERVSLGPGTFCHLSGPCLCWLSHGHRHAAGPSHRARRPLPRCVPAAAWQQPASAQQLATVLRVCARCFTSLPALGTLGRWYENSIFL